MAMLLASLAVLAGGAALAEAQRTRKAPAAPAAEHRASGARQAASHCKKDADCVVVPDDCCSCSEGGKQHAVARSARDAYEKERQKRCAGTMCAQMMSQDPSCAQQAVCRAGSCTLGDTPAR